MFETLQNALQNGEKLSLSVERKGDGLVVLAAFQGGEEGAGRTPLLLKGPGVEIDAAFEQQILTFAEIHSGLVSTLDAVKSVMDEAKKDASKKAVAPTKAAKAPSASADDAPAVTGATPSKPTKTAPAPVAEDPLLAELF